MTHAHVPGALETVLGIDLGSRNVKLCLMRDDTIIVRRMVESVAFYREYGVRDGEGFTVDLSRLGIETPARTAATGYGRMSAGLTGADIISELTAHVLGALHLSGLDTFTLLDLGGQDYKVVQVEHGLMTDMATNDKCAASTGRYLENMARTLGLSLDDLGSCTDDPVPISSTCAIFGESELIGLIVRGLPVQRLAAGVNRAVAERVLPHLDRMNQGPVVISGGVALNAAVVRFIGELTGRDVRVISDPLFTGAVGCCRHATGRNQASRRVV